MDIKSVTAGAFANGFDCFCPDCSRFFSVQSVDAYYDIPATAAPQTFGGGGEVDYCPCCGGDCLVKSASGLLERCETDLVDPANFYWAFPPGEPVPGSRTGATPAQVRKIINLASIRRAEERPLTAASAASETGIPAGVAARVFDEFHITGTPGGGDAA